MIPSSVIFLLFNRPEETARTFAAIRAARPPKLLVVADGPRPDRAGELDLCERARAVIERVDWPCEVLRNFAEINMGCGKRVSSGLDWAFGQVEEAIILEDDCVPDPSFFPYCTELLERYRTDERIMMISGNNFQNGARRTRDSYYFSRIAHIWGWATWRRAWRYFDFTMCDRAQRRNVDCIEAIASSPILQRHWVHCFDGVTNGNIDTWDYQWMYCILNHNGLSIAPDVNLVANIGFSSTGTHSATFDKRYFMPSRTMEFPLRHPAELIPCEQADAFEQRYLLRLFRLPLADWAYERLWFLLHLMQPFFERVGVWAPLRALAIRLGL